jgi:putative sigma-54 modulation protein
MQTRNVNLPITVTGRHMELTSAIKEYARKKIEGLHLDYPKIIEAKVILDAHDIRHNCEIILYCSNHITLEAKAETTDCYASMDEAVDKIARQMRKAKTRILKNQAPKNGGSLRSVPEDEDRLPDGFELDETPATDGKTSLRTMFVEEALLQLQLNSTPFLAFINAETDKPNILYRRNGDQARTVAPASASAAA